MTEAHIAVLKLGSSVLESEGDLPTAVLEIYRELRRGRRVVAVVSAFAEETDRLLESARRHFHRPQGSSLARLLATGEIRAAACLGMALDDAGVPNVVLDPADIALTTHGPILDADPHDLDVRKLHEGLREVPVVVLTGFAGRAADGVPTLLGRGGSDLTALFVAERLGARTCRLIKDVDGLYTADPRQGNAVTRRFHLASWEDAVRHGGELIQPKAVRYAQGRGRSFLVADAITGEGTVVGVGPSAYASDRPPPRPLRIALAGLGTVGLGVYRWLRQRPRQFEIVGILVRDLTKPRSIDVPQELLSDDPETLFAARPDVLGELIGGTDTADRMVRRALANGLNVVTANKALMASTPDYLVGAESLGGRLRFSASVGGAVPVLESVSSLARRFEVDSIEGVLNGTCNYVLDKLAEGRGLSEAVREAQANGFAEQDPTLDLSGKDSTFKLCITLAVALGASVHPDDIPCEGIDSLTTELVERSRREATVVRLVARAERTRGGWRTRVAPETLASEHPLSTLRGEENGVVVRTRCGRSLVLRGKGAGRWPTTLAVVADLVDLARCRSAQSHPASRHPHPEPLSRTRERGPDAAAITWVSR